jgi:hypothetical protein
MLNRVAKQDLLTGFKKHPAVSLQRCRLIVVVNRTLVPPPIQNVNESQ